MPSLHQQNDPARHLWERVTEVDFQKIEPFLSAVPIQIGKIAEELGLDVESITLPANISGLIRKVSDDEGERFVIEVNNTDASVRQRFTVAHEISHYLLHRSDIDAIGITDTILYRSGLSNKKEVEANQLAAALLMPWSSIHEWSVRRFGCSPTVEHIAEIASAFRVSGLSVGFRLGL